jgi:K+-transporting ATPase A subunit
MALQICQIVDELTKGTIYLEDWKGCVIVNNIVFPIQLSVEIVDVVDGVPTTFHSIQTITLTDAPTIAHVGTFPISETIRSLVEVELQNKNIIT